MNDCFTAHMAKVIGTRTQAAVTRHSLRENTSLPAHNKRKCYITSRKHCHEKNAQDSQRHKHVARTPHGHYTSAAISTSSSQQHLRRQTEHFTTKAYDPVGNLEHDSRSIFWKHRRHHRRDSIQPPIRIRWSHQIHLHLLARDRPSACSSLAKTRAVQQQREA